MPAKGALVLDASVVLSWCFEGEESNYPYTVLDRLETGQAQVPGIWALEVGNALIVAERRGRLTKADSTRFVALLGQLPIIINQDLPERMFGEIIALAREHNLSTYDASYLDLAMRSGLPLATQEPRLLHAARQCGVEIYPEQGGSSFSG